MTRYAQGGYIGLSSKYTSVGYLHHGEYIYRASDGTFWRVQRHPNGDIRTPANVEDDE